MRQVPRERQRSDRERARPPRHQHQRAHARKRRTRGPSRARAATGVREHRGTRANPPGQPRADGPGAGASYARGPLLYSYARNA